MSQENVDQFMKCMEAFDRMDVPGVLRLMDPEIQFEHRLADLYGSAVGLKGVEAFCADVAEHFDALKVECPMSVIWAIGCWRLAPPASPGRGAASRPSCLSPSWRGSGTGE